MISTAARRPRSIRKRYGKRMSASSARAPPASSFSRRRGTAPRHRRDHAHDRRAAHVDELGRLDLDVALVGEQARRLGVREEVRAEAVVLDQERLAALEPAEELHDRAAAAQPVGRVDDEAGVRQSALRRPEAAAARCLDAHALAGARRRTTLLPPTSRPSCVLRPARARLAAAQAERRERAPLGEDRDAHRLEELELAHHAVAAAAAARAARAAPQRELDAAAPGSASRAPPGSVMRVLVMCVCTPRRAGEARARARRRRRSSRSSRSASSPKVRLFIVPWLAASRPSAPSSTSTTRWLVSTLPPQTARSGSGREHASRCGMRTRRPGAGSRR